MFASPPTQAGLTAFLEATLPIAKGIGGPVLPSADVIQTSLNIACETVNDFIARAAPTQYVQAVYNLATHLAICLADDAAGQSYFEDLRNRFKIGSVSVGVVSSASNQASSMSQFNPDTIKQFTLAELDYLKTPYGRKYLEIAQTFGSALFGVS